MARKSLLIGFVLMFLFCNLTFTTLSNENNGSLSGYITDKGMNPISGAKVTIECGEHYYECYSNDAGYYHQDNIPIVDCFWKVTVSKVGYKGDKIQIPIDENSVHNFILSPTYTIYVDDDNIEGPWDGSQEFPYKIIQDAVDNANEGDTVFVYSGVYSEYFPKDKTCVLIQKSINLVGEDKYNTIINGSGENNVVIIQENDVSVSGFTIQNGGDPDFWASPLGLAIDIAYSVEYVSIYNNIIKNNHYGIDIYKNGDILVYNNTITGNCRGIICSPSGKCEIHHNIISNNYEGFIGGGNNIHIYGNVISNNSYQGISIGSGKSNVFIVGNHISDNNCGMYLGKITSTISNNNFINNGNHINMYKLVEFYISFSIIFQIFESGKNYYNEMGQDWSSNYWDDWESGEPKPISGTVDTEFLITNYGLWGPIDFRFRIKRDTYFEYDMNPAEEPYDITITEGFL